MIEENTLRRKQFPFKSHFLLLFLKGVSRGGRRWFAEASESPLSQWKLDIVHIFGRKTLFSYIGSQWNAIIFWQTWMKIKGLLWTGTRTAKETAININIFVGFCPNSTDRDVLVSDSPLSADQSNSYTNQGFHFLLYNLDITCFQGSISRLKLCKVFQSNFIITYHTQFWKIVKV